MKVETSHLLLTLRVSIFEHSDLSFTKKAAKTKKEYFSSFSDRTNTRAHRQVVLLHKKDISCT